MNQSKYQINSLRSLSPKPEQNQANYFGQVCQEIKSLILGQLSEFHKSHIISRSHYEQDLSQITFFVDTQTASTKSASLQQRKAITAKIQSLKGQTMLRYLKDRTNYIVVD